MQTNNLSRLYAWHRILGLLVGIPMLLWTISGIMHPLMSHFFPVESPRGAISRPPIDVSQIQTTPASSLEAVGHHSFNRLAMVQIDGIPHYQVRVPGQVEAVYLNAQDGTILADGEAQFAAQLARDVVEYPHAVVHSVRTINRFNNEYTRINRVLPVQQVRLEGANGPDLYIDTADQRAMAYNNGLRRAYLHVFAIGHRWSFLGPDGGIARTVIIGAFSVFTLIVAVAGVVLFFVMWKLKLRPRSRRHAAHRWLGLVFSLALIGFAFSGLIITWSKTGEQHDHQPLKDNPLPLSYLDDPLKRMLTQAQNAPFHNLDLVEMDGEHYFRAFPIVEGNRGVAEPNYYHANTLSRLPDGEALYAQHLYEVARKLTRTPHPASDVHGMQMRFDANYSFLQRRLPVHRFGELATETPAAETFFIETTSGTLSYYSTPEKRHYSRIFTILHKFHFLDALGSTARDLILMATTLLLGAMATIGVWCALRPTHNRR